MGLDVGRDPGVVLARAALFDAVDDRVFPLLEVALEAGESLVDALPPGCDPIDEQRKVD